MRPGQTGFTAYLPLNDDGPLGGVKGSERPTTLQPAAFSEEGSPWKLQEIDMLVLAHWAETHPDLRCPTNVSGSLFRKKLMGPLLPKECDLRTCFCLAGLALLPLASSFYVSVGMSRSLQGRSLLCIGQGASPVFLSLYRSLF